MIAEPTVTCPKCHTEIKLTETLAAPLIEATRWEYEQRLAQKDTDIAKREQTVREREAVLAREKELVDQWRIAGHRRQNTSRNRRTGHQDARRLDRADMKITEVSRWADCRPKRRILVAANKKDF
jgi:hypothetical protein